MHDNPTALTGCLHASLFILLPRRSSSSFYSNFLAFASLRFPLRLLVALLHLASSASRHGSSLSLYASLCAPRVFLMFLRERAFVVGIVHLRVSGRPGRRARLHSGECACRTNSLVARTHTASFPTYPACRLTDKDLVLSPFGRITDFLALPSHIHALQIVVRPFVRIRNDK